MLAHLSKPKSVEELLKTVAAEKASRAEEAQTTETQNIAVQDVAQNTVSLNGVTADEEEQGRGNETASAETAERAADAEDHEDTASEVKKTLTELFEKLREALGKGDSQKDTAEPEDTAEPKDATEAVALSEDTTSQKGITE